MLCIEATCVKVWSKVSKLFLFEPPSAEWIPNRCQFKRLVASLSMVSTSFTPLESCERGVEIVLTQRSDPTGLIQNAMP